MLKTCFFSLILAPTLSFGSFSIAIKPGQQTPLVNGSTQSCPKVNSGKPDDIQSNYFAIPPMTLKWSSPDKALIINAAHVTVYLATGKRLTCDITSEDVQDSLLPFYWTADGKRTLDPSPNGVELKQICTLKCGGLPPADPTFRVMSAVVQLDGYTEGAGPTEEYSARASFFVSAPF